MENFRRSANFNQIEIDLLLKLVGQHKSVLGNNKTHKINWMQKAAAWAEIEKEFNIQSNSIYRSVNVLRKKYENIKKTSKEKQKLYIKEVIKQENNEGKPTSKKIQDIARKKSRLIDEKIKCLQEKHQLEMQHLQDEHEMKMLEGQLRCKLLEAELEKLNNCN